MSSLPPSPVLFRQAGSGGPRPGAPYRSRMELSVVTNSYSILSGEQENSPVSRGSPVVTSEPHSRVFFGPITQSAHGLQQLLHEADLLASEGYRNPDRFINPDGWSCTFPCSHCGEDSAGDDSEEEEDEKEILEPPVAARLQLEVASSTKSEATWNSPSVRVYTGWEKYVETLVSFLGWLSVGILNHILSSFLISTFIYWFLVVVVGQVLVGGLAGVVFLAFGAGFYINQVPSAGDFLFAIGYWSIPYFQRCLEWCYYFFLLGFRCKTWLVAGVIDGVKFVGARLVLFGGFLLLRNALKRMQIKIGEKVYTWYNRNMEQKISIFGIQVPKFYFFVAALVLSLGIGIVIYSIVKKEKKSDIQDQAFGDLFTRKNWVSEPRRRALLGASAFVASLIAFGNLKALRDWMPVITFMGWIQQLLPNDSSVANTCLHGPEKCRARLPLGSQMCNECAAFVAIRTVETVRFAGRGKFVPQEMFRHLCEDIVTKADLDEKGRPRWFLAKPEIVKRAVLGDQYDIFMSGNMVVQIDGDGVVSIKTTLDPMTMLRSDPKHSILFRKAGLLDSEFLKTADITSDDLGLGWSASRPVTPVRTRANSVEEKKREFIPGDIITGHPSGLPPFPASEKTKWVREDKQFGVTQIIDQQTSVMHGGQLIMWRLVAEPGYSGLTRKSQLSSSGPMSITIGETVVEEDQSDDGMVLLDSDFMPLDRSEHVNAGTQTSINDSEEYVVFAKDSDFTVYRRITTNLSGWKLRFHLWKNTHPSLSQSFDVFMALIAILLTFLALAATFSMMRSWFSRLYKSATNIELERNEIADEGRGVKNRFVKRAESKGHVKSNVVPDYVADKTRNADFKARVDPDYVPNRQKNDREYSRDVALMQRGPLNKEFVFYNIEDIIKRLEKGTEMGGQGCPMRHPVTNQLQFAKSKSEFQKLYADGWRPMTGTMGLPTLKIPLETFRANPDLQYAMKKLLWGYRHPDTKISLTSKDEKVLLRMYGDVEKPKMGLIQAPPAVKSVYTMLCANARSEQRASYREFDDFKDFMEDSTSDASALVEEESNVQQLVDNRCPNEVNGRPCRNVGCDRHGGKTVVLDETAISDEGIIGPLMIPVNHYVVHKIQFRDNNGNWVERGGTCFSGPLGLYTAKHVLINIATNELHAPLDRVRVVRYVPSVQDCTVVLTPEYHKIDPLTIVFPRDEQMAPGQSIDFLRFRCVDKDFMKFCANNRVHFGDLDDEETKEIRVLRFDANSSTPTEVYGQIEEINWSSGEVAYSKANTLPGDSGAPVFNERGRCIGIHKGKGKDVPRNYFLLFYPKKLVAWFCQSEPKNL